ncbi:beta-ketoacyl-ACP synthase III [Streptomyces natalensis]|uniref:Beta-ketoacyl-[acyl-carrier-protein] synthase III n=1 Tax=Streptomyces natalensis ATCC 27448 TaxID=1240678 RepID=A0A0D7CL78_9ACTN|nr:beta-ketoacyl-ACP synthase III [Streptomyces natalensis]KIZ16187.1 3-oxoacyl-ACP synthase [Streptomyces natalensis ATCC 27448]
MTTVTPTAVIRGIGSCLPPQVLSNEDVKRRGVLDTTDEWIRTRTGIARRRAAEEHTSTGDLAVAAGRAAQESAHARADLLLLATTTPDRRCPATAPEVAYRLGLGAVPAFDLSAVCSGFVYAVTVATALVRTGVCTRPLVIGAETYSRIIDPLDRDTAVIFGDGAGAVLLEAGDRAEPGAIAAVDWGSDGSGSDLIAIAAGGSRRPDTSPRLCREDRYFRMSGRAVYGHAVRRMTDSSLAVLARAGWRPGTVGAFIGHQANKRILDSVADRVGIAPRFRHGNIRDVGNTAAASIPLALADTAARHRVQPGTRTLLTAFGGGLTWGSVALSWPAARPRSSEPEPRDARSTTHPTPEGKAPWNLSTTTS